MKVLYFLVFLCLTCISQVSHIAAADNYCDSLKYSLLFYKAQRAGRLPDNDIPWRGDSVLDDTYNNQVDSNGDGILSKGYFDAGDGVKFGFPMAYSMTMLSWIYNEYSSNINHCGLDSLFKDVIKWGSDYTIAAHVEDNVFVGQIADANIDHNYWIPPEKITGTYTRTVYTIDSSNPGTDLACEAAASLAATYLVFKSSDPTYANECLSHAKSLYSFAMNSDKKLYSDSISEAAGFYTSSGYEDEIAWASAWLYKVTGDSTYLENANTYYSVNSVQYNNNLSWDSKGVAVGMLLYQINGGSNYKTNVETALKYWQKGGGIQTTPNGLAYFSEWGPCRYSMNMALIAVMMGGDYSSFAESQLNYVLGNNANSYSFVVGIGSSYPKNPHHRAAHHSTTNDINNPTTNTYVLYGALVGGPASDDSYKDDRTDYTQSEVALDYNIGLVGTLAALSSDSQPASSVNPYGGEISTSENTQTSSSIETESPSVETESPTTETETPAVETETPTTESPTTESPTTESPTTESPTTESPTTESPTTESPTTESPNVETESPSTEDSDSATHSSSSSLNSNEDQNTNIVIPDLTSSETTTSDSTSSDSKTSDSNSNQDSNTNSGSTDSSTNSDSTTTTNSNSNSDSSTETATSNSNDSTSITETPTLNSNDNTSIDNTGSTSNNPTNNDSSLNQANTNTDSNDESEGSGSMSIHKVSTLLSMSLLIIYALL